MIEDTIIALDFLAAGLFGMKGGGYNILIPLYFQ